MFITKIITSANIRWNYPVLWTPKSFNGNTPKFSVQLLIPKTEIKTVNKLHAAMRDAYEEYIAEQQLPFTPEFSQFYCPLHDGDVDKASDPVYAGSYFITASSYNAPNVVDSKGNTIVDHSVVHPGVYGRACINMRGYEYQGNFGIACNLVALQLAKDGTFPNRPAPLGTIFSGHSIDENIEGAASSDDDFAEIDEIDEADFLK